MSALTLSLLVIFFWYLKFNKYTSWVEDKYEKREEDEEEKSYNRGQKVHNVGVYKKSASTGEELIFDEDRIFWNFESTKVTLTFLNS